MHRMKNITNEYLSHVVNWLRVMGKNVLQQKTSAVSIVHEIYQSSEKSIR